MIFGGAMDGVSNTSKEESGPVLEFGPENLRGIVTSHNDALVIQAIMMNYEVVRVFINAGSFVNALFKLALEQMVLNEGDLQYIATPLFVFSGHAVHPLG